MSQRCQISIKLSQLLLLFSIPSLNSFERWKEEKVGYNMKVQKLPGQDGAWGWEFSKGLGRRSLQGALSPQEGARSRKPFQLQSRPLWERPLGSFLQLWPTRAHYPQGHVLLGVGSLHLKSREPGLCFLLVSCRLHGFPQFPFPCKEPTQAGLRAGCSACRALSPDLPKSCGVTQVPGPLALFLHCHVRDKVPSENLRIRPLALTVWSFKFSKKNNDTCSVFTKKSEEKENKLIRNHSEDDHPKFAVRGG